MSVHVFSRWGIYVLIKFDFFGIKGGEQVLGRIFRTFCWGLKWGVSQGVRRKILGV